MEFDGGEFLFMLDEIYTDEFSVRGRGIFYRG